MKHLLAMAHSPKHFHKLHHFHQKAIEHASYLHGKVHSHLHHAKHHLGHLEHKLHHVKHHVGQLHHHAKHHVGQLKHELGSGAQKRLTYEEELLRGQGRRRHALKFK
jgi:hypothetical protein